MIELPDIPDAERTALVEELVRLIETLAELWPKTSRSPRITPAIVLKSGNPPRGSGCAERSRPPCRAGTSAPLCVYVLYQYHHCHVTQPLLREQLLEWGIDLSVGQIDALLSGRNEAFFAEKDQLLEVGLEVSSYITVEDSGARHQGRNGYVTPIGNDLFAWFSRTDSKSRINFLTRLQAGHPLYS